MYTKIKYALSFEALIKSGANARTRFCFARPRVSINRTSRTLVLARDCEAKN